MEGLFPKVPSDITKLSDKELSDLLAEYEHRAGLVQAEDEEFLAGRTAEAVLEAFREAKDTILSLRAEVTARDEAAERYAEEKEAISAELKGETPVAEEETPAEEEPASDEKPAGEEAPVDEEPPAEEEPEAVVAGDREPVLVASAEETPAEPAPPARVRRVPMPAPERVPVPVEDSEHELSFVASGFMPGTPPGSKLKTKQELGQAISAVARSVGRPAKRSDGIEERFLVASLDYSSKYPEERFLRHDALASNAEKVQAVYEMFMGSPEAAASLVASGGICAPPVNIYTIPQLATNARPVRDALPNFRAERGGINVPTPETIGEVGGAITVITESEDADGGTFATKHCLDMSCPDFTTTHVTIISHCREFGNLNAMSWPEKVAFDNELTMAGHARIAEQYLLDRIKAQSVNVTTGADTLGALIYLVDAIEKAEFGIRSRLRLPSEARFTLLAPRVLLDLLVVDTVSNQFDRYRTEADLRAYLASIGVDVSWYLDTPSSGVAQIQTTDEANNSVLEGFPGTIQLAFFPSGTFLHLDMASLELGIVRDSTLNSTNDFQIFGESFENVALVGPQQAAYWINVNLCPTGTFPPAGTARSCE